MTPLCRGPKWLFFKFEANFLKRVHPYGSENIFPQTTYLKGPQKMKFYYPALKPDLRIACVNIIKFNILFEIELRIWENGLCIVYLSVS